MKAIEAFLVMLDKIWLTDRWKSKGPGKVVESMSPEQREALSQLSSKDIDCSFITKDYHMMGSSYQNKLELLEFEKKLGIEPPPRKKYED